MIRDTLTAYVAHELQAAVTKANTGRIANQADTANEEIRAIYDEWLAEAAPQLEAAENEREHDELLALLLLLLSGRVRRRMERLTAQMADEIDADAVQMEAIRRQLDETLTYFDRRTLPDIERRFRETRIERAVAMERGEQVAGLGDMLSGLGARIALVGGIIWSAFQAAKKSKAGVFLEARWTGPQDSATCPPCDEQMRLGWRQVGQVPIPGPAVCLGLTSCRHDIMYRDPFTGREALAPEELT